MYLGVERPIGNIQTAHRVSERPGLELVRREPAGAIPLTNGIAHLRLGQFHRQQTFGPERLLDFLVGHEGGRSAEIAALADVFGIKHRNGLAALALHRDSLYLPAALIVGDVAQRGDKIVLLDDLLAGGGQFELRRRRRATIRTDKRLFGGVPLRLAAAGGTGEFFSGGGFRHKAMELTVHFENGEHSRPGCGSARPRAEPLT